jgi:Predicted AAA-ATPase/PD-(D/E)XK nuclease superfamily
MLQLPLGYSDFAEIIEKKFHFVDKTLFIKEILDSSIQAMLITRPRRFGKTLNLSMLRYFLAPEVSGRPTQHLFQGLKINEMGDAYMQHQGQYPVIFLTLKDIKSNTYEQTYAQISRQIACLYQEHCYLLSSEKLSQYEQEEFLSILEERSTPVTLGYSLCLLCAYLYRHYGAKPWLLIDEYDTPIHAGFLNGYYPDIVQFIRDLFGAALKDNIYLEKAVITGILRISKESLFSGANNVISYSVLDEKYSEYFGFTEAQVEQLLKESQLYDHYPDIREWYNGYQMGQTTIYNPWSLSNCIDRKGLLKLYWVNTSSNDLIRYLLARGDRSLKMYLEAIIAHQSITALIDENMIFGDLEKSSEAIWGLLLFSGYFKVIHAERKEDKMQCELIAPNREILFLYQGIVKDWLSQPLGNTRYLEFLLSLTEGRMAEFTDRLQRYLLETMSIFDATGREPEKFYHGFVLGMMVSLSETHEVKSNHESGYGRYDVMLIPKDREQLGVILEFKTVRDPEMDLKQAAQDALRQIAQRRYAAELQQLGIERILQLGLAFRGKQVAVLAEGDIAVEV